MSNNELATLADRAKSAFARARASRAEWIAATLELAATLCQARERLPNNDAFGIWLRQAGLETLSKDDRAALIGIGAHVAEAKEVFENYDGMSWRMAWQEIKHLRSLRTRDEIERTVEHAEATNVVALPAKPAEEATPLVSTGSPPKVYARESDFIDVINCLIYTKQFWQTTDELAHLVDFWTRGRGDRAPAASEIRDLARWFDDFAQAIETYRPKPRRRGGNV